MGFWCPLYNGRFGILFPQTIAPSHLVLSPMLTQADIPSDLTDNYKAFMFEVVDGQLNTMILYALLHGEQHHFMSSYVGANQSWA